MKTLLYTLAKRVLIGALFFTHCHLMATTYTLTLLTNGSGTVSANPNLAAYPANSVVTVSATPGPGYYFSYFSGAVYSTSNSVNVQMTGNETVSADFEPLPTYALTVSECGSGTVNLNPAGGSYISNTLVQATAVPATNWVFLQWSGAVSNTNATISLYMDSNASLMAAYVEPPLVDAAPSNTVAGSGSTTAFSIAAEASPTPAYQWYFIGSPIPGATATNLVLTNVQSAQAGVYSIVVSNAYGFTSNSAILTVTNISTGTNVVTNLTEDALATAINIGGVVTFASNGVISFSHPITVTNNVVLDGTANVVVLNGNDATGLFNISPGTTFSATNISFINGQVIGTPGSISGSNEYAGSNACGAAFNVNAGNLYLTGCSLISNSAIGGQGVTNTMDTFYTASGGAGMGGAIYITGGNLILRGTTLSSNIAFSPWGRTNAEGGAICAIGSTVSILDCLASNNLAYATYASNVNVEPIALGGAICTVGGSLLCDSSLLYSNMARGGDLPFSQFVPTTQGSSGWGGAIAALGTITITQSTFASNTAYGGAGYRGAYSGQALGGALYTSSIFSVTGSTFTSNTAYSAGNGASNSPSCGGAICNVGTGYIVQCTLYSNATAAGGVFSPGPFTPGFPGFPTFGGGIYNSGNLYLTNCTLTGNSSVGSRAGSGVSPPGGGFGGGIYNTNGVLNGVFLTIASNVVTQNLVQLTNGVYSGAQVANSNGTFILEDSIIAYSGTNTNAYGTITDGGYNISSDGTANFNSGTSFNYTDPELGPLQDNGGGTLTMALAPDSPAIDFGAALPGVYTDQRGYARPAGSGYDMGAFEYGSIPATPPPPTLALTKIGTNITLSFTGTSNTLYIVQSTAKLAAPAWSPIYTNTPPSNGTVTVPLSSTNSTMFYRLYLP